jgi:hypothetical protein
MRRKKTKFNKDVGIGITTFLRNSSLYRLIESIQEYLPDFKIYIVDQDKPTKFKETLYMGLKAQGHVIKYADYDCGISKARSIVHDIVQEPYIAWMQDDFTVTEKTNLLNMLDILKSNKKLGVIGGRLEGSPVTGSYSYYFLRWGDSVLYLPVSYCLEKNIVQWQKTNKGNQYVPADIVSEFTIWRKEVPVDVFDLNVHVIEHSHVYLKIKYDTDWLVAYTPDSEIKHYHDRHSNEYNKMRSRKDDIDYILKYWNIKDLVKFTTINKYKFLLNKNNWHYEISEAEKSTVLKFHNPPIIKNDEIKKQETFKTLSQDETVGASMNVVNAEVYNILNEFIDDIQKFDKNCYLAHQTCWEAVVKHAVVTSPLYVSIPRLNESELQYLKNKGFDYNGDDIFIKDNYTIKINYKIPRKFKTVTVDGNKYLVPLPVHQYLRSLYGDKWQTKDTKR